MMDITLGAIPSSQFLQTPYERLLGFYRKSTGVDLVPIFDELKKEVGTDFDGVVQELMRRAKFSDYVRHTFKISTPEIDPEDISDVANEIWFAYRHYLGGEKVFRIHSELAKALNDTDLRVPAAYLALPFDGLCLSYEGDVLLFEAPEMGVVGHVLDAIYVMDYTESDASTEPNARRLMIFSKSAPGGELKGSLSLDAFLPSVGEGAEVVDEVFSARFIPSDYIKDPRSEIVKLALKTIAYINSAGADALERPSAAAEIGAFIADPRTNPPREERRKLERRAGRSSRLPYIYVGSRLPQPREEPVSVLASGVRKLTYRFAVRGHFHGFWKLKRNLRPDETSWIKEEETDGDGRVWTLVVKWVHPYEKGPEEAEKIHRRYYVQGVT